MTASRAVLLARVASLLARSPFPPPPPTSLSSITTIKDVLPSEENAPAWKEHVYSYELDLFSSDDNNSSSNSANTTSDKTTTRTAPPIQAYSATNPSKRRFDLLRLAPYVTLPPSQVSQGGGDTASAAEACQAEVNASTPAPIGPPETSSSSSIRNDGTKETTGNEHHESSTATATTTGAMTRVPAFVECDTSAYSTEHSFFVGYAWCFCHCGNCGAFLGWGFAAEDRLRAALREQQQQQQEEKEEEKKTMKEKTAQEDAVGRLVGGDGSSSANSDPSNGPHGGVDVRVASRRRIERDRREGSTDLETVQADETDTAEAVESRRGADGASTSPHPGQQGQNYEEEEENEEEQDEEEEDDASLPSSQGSRSNSSSRSSRSGGDTYADTFTFKGTAVSPDFIGIIITHCTGEAHYPTSTLLDEAMLRPFRVRRRKLVQHLLRQLRRALVDMADGYRAHQLHYASEMVVARLFEQPPSPEISAVEATASQQQQQQGEVELVYDDSTVQYLRDLLHLARTALHNERGGHSIDDGASAHEEEDEEEESDTDGL